ncbi:MAG TPA: type III-B CRISPR module-associated protein Cmr5 [Ktedonobacteraceae bacterium]|nr:type III-B CRISPR module-associated protein Cmr5 [Ktedonobacteraceae bacterium]
MTTQTAGDQQQRTGTRRQTLEQKRARRAWDNVKWIKQESEDEDRKNKDTLQKEYRTRVSQLNTMIQVNGLGAALGFLLSKGEQRRDEKGNRFPRNAYDYLLYHLTWWTSRLFPIPDPGPATSSEVPPGHAGLLDWITDQASSSDYRRVTTECLAFGIWLRRFAEAELKAESPAQETPIEAAAEASGSGEAAAPLANEAATTEQTGSVTSSQEGTK